ncbi:MAG: hypothetical protein HGA98_01205 [Deltaproteobacteria bacterium]|nr:hypothetical protein [Deltaproteobacteria bacterium]
MTPPLEERADLLRDRAASAPDGLLWLAGQLLEASGRSPLALQKALAEVAELAAGLGTVAAEAYAAPLAKVFGVGVQTVRTVLAEAAKLPVSASLSGPPPQGGSGNHGTYPPETLAALEELSQRHCVLLTGGAVWVARKAVDPVTGEDDLEFLTFGDFSRYYGNRTAWVLDPVDGGLKRQELPKVWLRAPPGVRPEYEGLVFSPGKDAGSRYLNLWRGLSVTARKGECSRYWRHVEEVICLGNPELYAYVRKWMAHAVQRPWEVPGVALVLRGLQGTGKGVFATWFGEIFGKHFMPVGSMDLVSGRFNSHLKDVLVLFADEALWGGDRSRDGLLKQLVTEKWLTVEGKGKDAIRVQNFKRLIVATNNSWPMPRDKDDRRTVVIDVPDGRKEDRGWFGAIEKEMRGGGLEALLWDLEHEDLSGFDPRARPSVDCGFDMKLRSASSPLQWWHQVLVDQVNVKDLAEVGDEVTIWNESPGVDDLYGHYVRWADGHHSRYIEVREHWGRELRSVCAHLSVVRPRWGGSGSRARQYRLGTLDQCRAAFQAAFRSGPEIWGDGEEEEDF